MLGRKNLQEIRKKRWTQFTGKLEKVVLECQIQNRNKGEQCLEIFCNYLLLPRHINLDGINKISVSKELTARQQEGFRT